MEYTITDLFKIIIKKKYIVFIVIVLTALVAVPLSNFSYKYALIDYQKYTSGEYANVSIGITTFNLDRDAFSKKAYSRISTCLSDLQYVDIIINNIATKNDLYGNVYINAREKEEKVIILKIFNCDKEAATLIANKLIRDAIALENIAESEKFILNEPVFESKKEFNNIIMQEPIKPVIDVKFFIKNIVISFCLCCFVILIITFIKDSKKGVDNV